MSRQAGFWDCEEHFARLAKGGDSRVTLAGWLPPGRRRWSGKAADEIWPDEPVKGGA